MVSYGINNDGCKFAALQCSNPKAKEIVLEVSKFIIVYMQTGRINCDNY